MILSKRERTIVVVTTAVLPLFLADRFFLSPILSRRERIETETGELVLERQKAESLFKQKRQLAPRWREMTDSGLGTGAEAAESRMLHAIRDWAQEAELNLASVKHERTEMERQFQKITWRAAASGSMAAVSRFLYRVQEASLPVRISDLVVAARQEGSDSLSIQVGISTLCMTARTEKAPPEDAKPAVKEAKE
jgi:hypothetical protein